MPRRRARNDAGAQRCAGPVTAVNGVPASQIDAGPDAWILRGDRGLSYAADFPPANTLVSGKWWPRDYAGPPLISIDDDAAKALGLKIGDEITVSVLGVEITATIASTRKIDWQSLGFNFAILFAPGTLEAAPHGWMATLSVTPEQERAVQAGIGEAVPHRLGGARQGRAGAGGGIARPIVRRHPRCGRRDRGGGHRRARSARWRRARGRGPMTRCC